jgi:transcription antitermination factor NusG
MNAWYVLRIKGQRETDVLALLNDAGVGGYYPRRVVWRKMRGKPRERREYPLLSGFLFVHMDELDTGMVLGLRDVYGFLGVRGTPVAIRERDVSRMIDAEARGDYDETLDVMQHLTWLGQDVVIEDDGAFHGRVGKLIKVDGENVSIEVSMMGKAVLYLTRFDKIRRIGG